MKKWILRLALFLVVCAAALKGYYILTDDFRIGNITEQIPFHPEWEVTEPAPEARSQVDDILNQPFSYVGKGSQSYVFVSADQNYVIKFFKYKHLRPSWLVTWLPSIPPINYFQKKENVRKSRKLNRLFSGYHLAYERARDESGLVYLQLNPSHREKQVHLIDKMGLERTVDLGQVVYIIQKKGETLRTLMARDLDKGDLNTVEKRIAQIFAFYKQQYRKGIYDLDHAVMQNYGFMGDQPLHMDVGQLMSDEKMTRPENYLSDMDQMIAKMMIWIDKYYPQYKDELTKIIDRQLFLLR